MYIGSYIALRREAEYETRKVPVTMFKLSKDTFLDGNRDMEGKELPIEANIGAWLNHSISKSNCKIIRVNNSLVIVATVAIPSGTELVYDYNDKRTGVPQWLRC